MQKEKFIKARPCGFPDSGFFLPLTAGKSLIAKVIASTCLCLLLACDNRSSKFNQYYVHGEKLYVKHCSNCHQKDGTGLGRIYPPLNISDYMANNFEEVICLIRFGKKGALIVNGREFNQPMTGVSTLSDLEIAEIATYIYNTWSHDRGIVEVRDVTKVLDACEEPD